MKNDYYEKKNKKNFNSFDKDFRQTIASYDLEICYRKHELLTRDSGRGIKT